MARLRAEAGFSDAGILHIVDVIAIFNYNMRLTSAARLVGANCHPLLEQHVAGALRHGLTAGQVRSAIKMALFVQQHAAEVTAAKAAAALEAAAPSPAAAS